MSSSIPVRVASRLERIPLNVFAYFSALAVENGAVNLGQGFPTFGTPDFVAKAAKKALSDGMHHQYTRPAGDPLFGEHVSSMYSDMFGGNLNGATDVVVYAGAQQGINCALNAFCEPGDDIVVIEPCFDAYLKVSSMLDVNVVGVPLRRETTCIDALSAKDFRIDIDELRSKITDKTKMLVLNTPQTFLGKAYSQSELQDIADVVRENEHLVVLSDEVYEFMCFEGTDAHRRFASLPGMFDRTISLFSAGKTFSCTGWRCGYSIAPEHFSKPLADAMANSAFCAPHPLSRGVTLAFEHVESEARSYFFDLQRSLETKSEALRSALSETALRPVTPEGGYFMMADCSRIRDAVAAPPSGTAATDQRDWKFCEWMTKEVGVVAIPASSAFSEGTRSAMGEDEFYVRFAFCKSDEELEEASKRLLAASERYSFFAK